MRDGRGQANAKRKAALNIKIKDYVASNPDLYRNEVAKNLNISTQTLRVHLKIISESSE